MCHVGTFLPRLELADVKPHNSRNLWGKVEVPIVRHKELVMEAKAVSVWARASRSRSISCLAVNRELYESVHCP